MGDTVTENLSPTKDDAVDSVTTESTEENKPNKTFWTKKPIEQVPHILDPDDALMQRFQNALKAHLTRLDNKLAEEILDLEAEVKDLKREHEEESLNLYCAQQDIAQQQGTIEKYQSTLMKIISLREEKEQKVSEVKKSHKEEREKLQEEKQKEEKLSRELQKLTNMQNQFAEWEQELAKYLSISKRICKKDAAMQQELITQKQEKDCLIFKLREEVWRLEDEINNLTDQIQLKVEEKLSTSQLVADANADLEALHREHANLCAAWNAVVQNISKHDKVYEQLNEEREKLRETFNVLQREIDKLKKETVKETENNEYLTSLYSRVEDDIRNLSRSISNGREHMSSLESELMMMTRLAENTMNDYNSAHAEYQEYVGKEEQIDKELSKLINWKTEQENLIFEKLKDKVTQDKAARYLNKLLSDAKEAIQEQEILLVQAENAYGKSLLELAKLNTAMANEKADLQELVQKNSEKESEINEMQKEASKCITAIERKRMKIINLNKAIEQILANTGGEEVNPQVLKIMTLEKNIQELEQKNQASQQFWLRQQGYMVTLSQQRDEQLQQLNLLSKEVMIMQQRNMKIQVQLEKFQKEDAVMDRTVNLLHQKLIQLNANLLMQKEMKEGLEDKNCIKRNEYMKSLEEAELELIKLQNDLRDLMNEKLILKEELSAAQRESLSWEKKVQIMQEASKQLRDERSSGGDISVMKNEIHKMEVRLSQLKRAQEKLISDMEFCVDRRDIIMTKAIGKIKKNPKEQHNQRFLFAKRLEDQKMKIKQMQKEVKQTETKIVDLEKQLKEMMHCLDKERKVMKEMEDIIPDLEQEIMKKEMLKCHKLRVIVFKQRKLRMLEEVKSGSYKMLYKSERQLDEQLQREQIVHSYLQHVMEETNRDFPLLKNNIQKIRLTLQIL